MPWASITLAPGLNTELTPTINQSGYTNSNLIRFKSGLAQKLGGWLRYFSVNLNGIPYTSHAWQDITGNKRFAVGTSTQLYDLTNGSLNTLTPQILTTNPTVNFATSSGSPVVTVVDTSINTLTPYDAVFFRTPISVGGIVLSGVYQITQYISSTSYTITTATNATATVAAPGGAVPTFTTTSGSANVSVGLAAHGLTKGDDVVFPIATSLGGVTVFGRYVVQSVTSSSVFVITVTGSATSSVGPTSMNGGNVGFSYYIAIGPQTTSGAYGAGVYGAGVYGLGSTLSGQSGSPLASSDWTLDNWGELLVSCPAGGGVYYWGPNSGFVNSSLITSAPFYNTGVFVSIAQQMIIAYGSTVQAGIGIYQDPMQVKWCDVEDFTTWIGTDQNQAGSYRIPTGSKIVGGLATPHQNLLWTDLDLWSMTYIGADLVFGFNKVGANCGLIAKHAKVQLSDTVYWMSTSNFFMISGTGVTTMPCPVWDTVFQDLDVAHANLCHAGSNSLFSEVWFFYPSLSGGLGVCDKYVKYCVSEGTWDIGSMQRNTWLDASVVGTPMAITNTGVIYSHENGVDADVTQLNYFYETGWFYVDNGRTISFVDRIVPDFKWGEYGGSQNAAIMVTIKTVNFPGDTPVVYGPYTVTQATNFISKRFRARQIMFRFEGADMGSFSRLGLVRIRFQSDGRGQ